MIVEWNTHIFSPDTAKYPHDPDAPKKIEDLVAQEPNRAASFSSNSPTVMGALPMFRRW